MVQQRHFILSILALSSLSFLITACNTEPAIVTVIVPVTVTSEQSTGSIPTAKPRSLPTQIPPSPTELSPPTAIQDSFALPCSETDSYIGQTVSCQIENAYCSYRPDVAGEPTFCNDAPFPGHSFTLLVWEQDWSDLDGKCLHVSGVISRYRGKLEIVAESRTQVSQCR